MIQLNIAFAPGARRYISRVPSLTAYLITVSCLTMGLSAAGQASNENENRCANPMETSDLRIGACTALIQSGQQSADYLAVAYNNRGNGYKDNGDYDRAIQDYSSAINLKPDYALAFYNRGNAYSSSGEYDHAIQDYNRVIQLQPDDATVFYAFYGRGHAYSAKGDYDLAIQDYDNAIKLRPDDANVLIVRGIANYLRADLAGAVMDFQRASELDPTIAYDLLWLHLARNRIGKDDRKDLTERSAKVDPSQWPAPILQLYMGEMTIAQVMAAAASSDAHAQKGQLCEANFFAGEDALLHQRDAAAKALLQAALNVCPGTDLHYGAAEVEYKRLTAMPAPPKAAAPAR